MCLILMTTCDVGAVVSPIIQMGKPRHRMVKWLAWGQAARKCQSWGLNPERLALKSTFLFTWLCLFSNRPGKPFVVPKDPISFLSSVFSSVKWGSDNTYLIGFAWGSNEMICKVSFCFSPSFSLLFMLLCGYQCGLNPTDSWGCILRTP